MQIADHAQENGIKEDWVEAVFKKTRQRTLHEHFVPNGSKRKRLAKFIKAKIMSKK